MSDKKVIQLRGGQTPSPERHEGSVEGALQNAITELQAGNLKANKCLIVLLDESAANNHYNVRMLGYGMWPMENVGLIEAVKTMILKSVGF